MTPTELRELNEQYADVARKRPIEWLERDQVAPFDTDTFRWPGDAPAAYVVRRRRKIPEGGGLRAAVGLRHDVAAGRRPLGHHRLPGGVT